MSRFVLSFPHPALAAAHKQSIEDARNLRLIDSSPNMLLVEGEEADVKDFASQTPEATLTEEKEYSVGPRRPGIRKSPSPL